MSHASGLAAAIRGSTESDTFDLAGQNTSTITTNITHAFESPLPIQEMIRITLLTGAGKLARQKYDENAAKAVTTALRDLGFEEDRGASCIKECAGSFKLQHDTGKNLKTVVVFPRIQQTASGEGQERGDSGAASGSSVSMFPKGSPKEMIALSSKNVFESMVKSRCPTWSQKKGCAAAIGEIKTILESLEAKLLQGHALEDAEQVFYDQVSSTSLEEKLSYVKDQMHHQVEEGSITSKEKAQLLSQVAERLETIAREIAEAEANGQPKKAEKLKGAKEKAEARKEMLGKISPKAPPPLKHQKEIFQLRTELSPLLELEEGAKGRLLSVKETQSLARKDDILEEIASLEEQSLGWFEDDETFQARVEACTAVWNAQNKSAKKGAKKAAPSASSTSKGSAWVTNAAKPKANAWKTTPATQKTKPSGKGGGVFAAMMMDSDSE